MPSAPLVSWRKGGSHRRVTHHQLAADREHELRGRPLGKMERGEKVGDEVVEDGSVLELD